MRASLLFVCALVSAGLLSGPADARSRDRHEQHQDHRQGRQEQRQASRQERQQQREEIREDRQESPRGDRAADAARRAQQRNGGGRVLSVDPEGGGYRVKVLKDGEVRTHHVDVED